jgi:ribonucleoside-diphosphate reductase beta chain
MPIDYSQRERSFELYRKGKREGTWDPDDFTYERDREDWAEFSEGEQSIFLAIASAFYEGEEDVTRTLAPYMTAMDALDGEEVPFDPVQEEVYLSQQVYEEAKHTDFFSRYFEEVFGTHDTADYRRGTESGDGYTVKDLYGIGEDLLDAAREGDQRDLIHQLGRAYMEYMGIVEALGARRGYHAFDQMAEIKADDLGKEEVLPGFQEAVAKVRQDETRHIENGRWVLQQLAEADPDVVTEVYEPRIETYVENEILNPEDVTSGETTLSEAYPEFDGRHIRSRALQYIQDTVDYVGREKFDQFHDVRAAVEQRRADGDSAAAAGDD